MPERSDPSPVVRLHNVVKRYGADTAVAGVSLEVARGELVALLGPSGCGKTTTLRMIAGFVAVTEGRVLFGQADMTHVPPRARNVGMVFQGYALFPHMSVFHNVAFGLEMRRVGKAEISRRVDAALATVRMQDYAARLPSQLSGGQQQRIALARAIVIRPDILLLDEPLSALDAKLREEVRAEIKALQRDLGLTTLLVTHDQEEALSMADRIVVMSKGTVQQIGTPTDIYERPATREVASFVGRCNFIEGSVDGDGGFRPAAEPSLSFPVGLPPGPATLAIRPENLHFGEPGGLTAIVSGATYMGTSLLVEARLADGSAVAAALLPGKDIIPATGTEVRLGWAPERALAYPGEPA